MFENQESFHCEAKELIRDRDMFGVVLWSDEQEQKAVIWCEDHGDLAFYRKTGDAPDFTLDAGDWVQFDMTMEHRQRFAHNPKLIHEGVYPNLADALGTAPQAKPERPFAIRQETTERSGRETSAQIIPFGSAVASRPGRASDPAQLSRA